MFRSFNAENLGSVGQVALKLPAVKVGGLKKKSASRPRPHSNHSAQIRSRANSNHSQSLMAGNFAALWPTNPKFSALKDLILFSTLSKDQKASSILKVGFVLSKWPHLHRVYLLGIRYWSSETVYLWGEVPCAEFWAIPWKVSIAFPSRSEQ